MNKRIFKITYKLLGTGQKISLYILCGLSAFFMIVMLIRFLSGSLDKDDLSVFLILTIYASIFLVLSFRIVYNTLKSVKTLHLTGKLSYADEILTGDYNTDGKLCFSKHLMHDKKQHTVTAYGDIVLIYYDNNYERYMLCTVDGKKHPMKTDGLTMEEFLKRRPEIVYGNSELNMTFYKNKVEKFKSKKSLS